MFEADFLVEQKIKGLKLIKLRNLQNEKTMQIYRIRPDLWLRDRFGEDLRNVKWDEYPGYDGHSWDGDKNPLLAAWQALADGYDTGVESATSTGKTYWLARVVFWFLDCFDNPLVVTSAPKQAQLKEHLWSEISRSWDKFTRLRPHALLTSLKLRKDMNHPKFNDSAEALGFVAGVGASEESATKAQGFHRENMLIIIEETPGVNQAIIKAFENTSTGTNNLILAVGNPDNIYDGLHQFCEGPGVKSFRISAYDHPNYVLKKEIVPGAVTVRSVGLRRQKYGKESAFYKSRVRGISPEQAVDSLIQLPWLKTAFDEKIEIPKDNSYNAVGIDVANSEDGDKAALAWGRENVLDLLQEFHCPNANHIAYNVLLSNEEIDSRDYHNYGTAKLEDYFIHPFAIGIDAVGVGTGTINTFIDEGMQPVSLQGKQLDGAIMLDELQKPLYTFVNLRSQMFWELREDLRNGKIKIFVGIDKEKQLTKELLAHRYETKGGRIAVTKKDEIKKLLGGKSPNLADAVAYWNWVRKGYYQGGGYSGVYAG